MIEIVETEEDLKNGHLLFSVRFHAAGQEMDFKIAIQDQGCLPLNETVVLRSSLSMAEALEASLRARLEADHLVPA